MSLRRKAVQMSVEADQIEEHADSATDAEPADRAALYARARELREEAGLIADAVRLTLD
ncbi:hypothetical protein QQY24_31995 [Streptomyces sp. TG1A-8]|uniref:hypothetical protein n=1 Tax=Streptomyces sp. TG1A-8 TaxID=3051385 RepID=UPI00265BCCBE|nr:hypothetical protein [Streptomyces sp. TG1A-8]MDO0929748.1 hypothetical protein [Streptomyces sp. TG1A-8]